MAIISTSDYNAYAGTSGQDTLIGTLIGCAQAAIERHCDVGSFDSATYTDQAYDGNGTDTLAIRNYPITAVSAVELRDGLADATPVELAPNTYTFATDRTGFLYRLSATAWPGDGYALNGEVRLVVDPVWPEGRLNVLVTYTAGYSSQTMPSDLKMAMFRLVDAYRGRIGTNPGLQSESLGAYSYTNAASGNVPAWLASITPEVASLLAPYRRCGT